MNIADALERWARERPAAPAIVEDAGTLRYRDLDAAVWGAASRLVAEGLRPGDRVGLSLAGNSALYLVLVHALARVGAVTMLLPVGEPAAVRLALARRYKLAAIIGDDDGAQLDARPLLRPTTAWLAPGAVDVSLRAPGGPAPWMLLRSSGTTGAPKVIARSHQDQLQLHAIGHRQPGCEPGDRLLALIAFHFSYGLFHPMLTLAGGGTVRIPPQPISMRALADIIDRENITRLALTATLVKAMLPHFAGERPRFPGLRRLALSTMATPETLRREIRRRLTPNLVITYATTEAWYVTSADAAAQIAFPETAGLAVDGVEIEIADDRGEALPAGEVGFVRLRAPALPDGYVDDPAATARAFRGGWYYPGDLGVLSPEGALHLKGRADDMINLDGIKIYPDDIEAALLAHPAVAEVAAFPVLVDGFRQIPVAAVVLRTTASSDALLEFCRSRLGFRAPRYIHAVPALPRSPVGKVLKRELARQFGAAGRPASPSGS